jgi:hypothetical protein
LSLSWLRLSAAGTPTGHVQARLERLRLPVWLASAGFWTGDAGADWDK